MERQPAVRASAVRDALAFLDKFERGAQAKVLAQVPAASREVIESTARSAWIGIEHDHYTIDAIIALFGRQRAIQFWAQSVSELSNKPLLKAFVSGMFKLMPVEPSRVVKIFVSGWPLIYRDMCTLEVVEGEGGQPELLFSEIAPQVRRYRNYLASWHGACAGFVTLADMRAELSFRAAPDASSAVAVFASSAR